MHAEATFRIARPGEYSRVEAAYAAWGYGGGVSPEDVVYIAEKGEELVAVVRRTPEHGIVMLRGMYVTPELQRRGIGSRLLDAFVKGLGGVACYCVPYTHLRGFYGRVGFEPLADEAAPNFLRDRLASYRARGLDVLVMRRPATTSNVLSIGKA